MTITDFKLYINGQFENGVASFESINPANETVWATIPEAREADVNRAVAAASEALNSPYWTHLTASERGKLLYRLADLLEESAPILGELETLDTGKIIRETTEQIKYVAEYYRYYAGIADKLEGSYLPIDKNNMHAWIKRVPIGVVAAVIPWNSQLFLTAVKLGPALAAGCSIVIKASEEGPTPLLEFAKLIDKAGIPPGIVNIITGFGDTCGEVLTSHPDIAHIAFTGGPTTARHIVKNTAVNLASLSLELGGKSPFIVFEDADLQSAVNAQIAGIFAAAGQSCVAGSRLIIHEAIKEDFLQLLLTRVKSIKIGDPGLRETEFGPLATAGQLKMIEKTVAKTIEEGAKLLVGGKRLPQRGFYYPPTILDCTGLPQASSLQHELFGPVLSVDTFTTEEEAVQKANSTPYGLAAGIFTNNLTRAHRLMDKINSGIIWVNTYRVISPIAPFGGFGMSGYGREGGIDAVLDYTTTKTIWLRTSDDPIDDPFIMR